MTSIRTITLPLPLRMGAVNCYLLQARGGCVLIDTGSSNRRATLEAELDSAGCGPGDLHLIFLTHGDFDHTGNAAYLRHKFATQIAMHAGDSGMAERGDMFSNRKSGNPVIRLLAPLLFGFSRANRFTPDLSVDDGYDLDAHGLDARVVSLPGHSAGSIGVLTAGGDLFCGDLFENLGKPALNSIMDRPDVAVASSDKLKGLGLGTVYPGHGQPFALASFLANH